MELLFIGGLGTTEIVLIIVVVLILFGGKKIPELMKGAGKGIREFKDAMNAPAKEEEKKDSPVEEVKKEEKE